MKKKTRKYDDLEFRPDCHKCKKNFSAKVGELSLSEMHIGSYDIQCPYCEHKMHLEIHTDGYHGKITSY